MQTVIRQAFSPRTRLRCSLKGNTSTSSDEDYTDENDAHCGNASISSDVDDIFIYIKRWQSAESDKHKVFSGKSSDCNGDGGRGDDDDDGDGGHGDDADDLYIIGAVCLSVTKVIILPCCVMMVS